MRATTSLTVLTVCSGHKKTAKAVATEAPQITSLKQGVNESTCVSLNIGYPKACSARDVQIDEQSRAAQNGEDQAQETAEEEAPVEDRTKLKG
jgi:hypothetical protein